jgi:hypothetical protein
MSALNIIRQFEYAAYLSQNRSPQPALIYHTEEPILPQSKHINQKTWEVFNNALQEWLGKEKFDQICNRYEMDPLYLQRTGAPLYGEYVERFSIGASRVFLKDIKRMSGKDAHALTRDELKDAIREAQAFRNMLGRHINPVEIAGTPDDFKAWFVFDALLMDREKQLLFSDVEHLTYPAFLERLTKSITNRELEKKQIIPVPGEDGDLDYYRVYKKIATGDGLVAYALKPVAVDSHLNNLLVFRQTQMALSHEDALPSIFNDLETDVGKSGYAAAKSDFEDLMNDPDFLAPDAMLEIAGFSLGGAHAQRFLADFHSRVSVAHFYSDPSIDAETAERFEREVQEIDRPDSPLKIFIYRVVGDYVHYVGQKHIGWHVDPDKVHVELIEVNHEKREIALLSAHCFKMFDNNAELNYNVSRIDSQKELSNHLDNSKRGAEVVWHERMRLIWGKILHVYFYFIYAILKGFGKLFGITILRSSKGRF